MSDDTRTENDAVIEAANLGVEPDQLEPGNVYGYKLPGRVELVDLTADRYLDEPRRKAGTVVVDDVAAFAQHYAKHADEASEVFASIDDGTITAVLDAHGGTFEDPRWQGHRLVLRLRPTEQWKTWSGKNRVLMPQQTFAEFLEDNLVDIAPDPVDAATMLEVATSFQAKTKVSFSSGTVLSSGEIRLNYQEETDATAGAKGQITVPKVFAIGVAPFDDVEPYKVSARLRHRIEGGHLKLCYILDRPEDVVRDAVKTVVAKVEEATGIKVMRGTPAA